MTISKRTIKSMVRRPTKNIVFLCITIILGTVMAGAVSIRNAIDSTVSNLRYQLPPIVTVMPDFDYLYTRVALPDGGIAVERKEVEFERITITSEHLYSLSELYYVRDYNFSTNILLQNFDLITTNEVDDRWSATDSEAWNFIARGYSTPNIIYFTEGVLEIIEGRLPTQEELSIVIESTPIVISLSLAQLNQLSVGSMLEMVQIIPDWSNHSSGEVSENIFAQKSHDFEVVGIFTPIDDESHGFTQTIFTSFLMIEEFARFEHEQQLLQMQELGWSDPNDEFEFNLRIENAFVLNDSRQIADFKEAAQLILPDLVIVQDLSNVFTGIMASMETLEQMASSALLFSSGASIIILGLLSTLMLYDRRHEIGIYLALGERKRRIMKQILSEILTVTCLGITLSLLAGNLISMQISQTILQNELTQFSYDVLNPLNWNANASFNLTARGFGREMSHEEMLYVFDVSLNSSTIIQFLVIGLGAVFISTALPIIYLTKLNLKEVLMQAKIE